MHCKPTLASKIHLQCTISRSLSHLVTPTMRLSKRIALHMQAYLTPMRMPSKQPSLPALSASTSRLCWINCPHQRMAPFPANMHPRQPLCHLHPPSKPRSQPPPTYRPDHLRKISPRRTPITILMMIYGRSIHTAVTEAPFSCSHPIHGAVPAPLRR